MSAACRESDMSSGMSKLTGGLNLAFKMGACHPERGWHALFVHNNEI
jgi:hypothetical protein